MSVWWLLIRAHDHVIADRRWALADRWAAAAILFRLAIAMPEGLEIELPMSESRITFKMSMAGWDVRHDGSSDSEFDKLRTVNDIVKFVTARMRAEA